MIISYQWLLTYLPEALPVAELSNILTSIGLEVEAVEIQEAVRGSLEGLVIGEVLTSEKHPNADKLSVTTVDIGSENSLKIVCGAPNVAAGQRVVIAPVGTFVHPTEGESFQIKKAKIRGEESEGMICAEDEIGLGSNHQGILVLAEDAPVGAFAKDYFKMPEPDYAIHIGLTPNRSDAMSHIGVARDVCAYLSHHRRRPYNIQLPSTALPGIAEKFEIAVSIANPEGCQRYTGISITAIKVGSSPEWLQRKLKTIGVRSINNVVDITNFVLHEFGQPLHAFDADEIKGKQVKVGFLKQGTPFVTLDGEKRTLNENDLMICDRAEGMCIAGVFGGIHSGVKESTKNIFLESAYFDPTHIRRTSLYHGLRTDAATHFEKGVDIGNVVPALKRAAALICEIAGGKISSEIVDVYPKQIEQTQVRISYRYIQKLSGKEYDKEEVKNILMALGFTILNEENEGLALLVPTNKKDVLHPADVVEEILRIDGLDNIAIPKKLNISLSRSKPNDRDSKEKLSDLLCGEGFQEIITNSIVNSKYYPERSDLVHMMNSLTSELDIMRPSMLESGLEVIIYNRNRKNVDLFLYEFGNVYKQDEGRYSEEKQLALWITGNVKPGHWNQKAEPSDLFFLKGVLQNLMRSAGIKNSVTDFDGIKAIWKYKKEILCTAMPVESKRLEAFEIKQDVFFAEINWSLWEKAAADNKIIYKEVPRFPAVNRDLAIILDKEVTYQQVQQATEQLKLEALKDFILFDVFESEKLGTNKKSYALSYTFQLQDKTLTEAEIEQLMSQLVGVYKSKLQAQIREQ